MTSSTHKLNNPTREAPFPSTTVLTQFSAFLDSLPQFLADERDLSGYSGQDPAVSEWIRTAEASQKKTLAICEAILEAAANSIADRALQKVAETFQKILLTDDPEEVTQHREHARIRRWAWKVPSNVHKSSVYNAAINVALDALEVVLMLEDIFDARALDWAETGPDA